MNERTPQSGFPMPGPSASGAGAPDAPYLAVADLQGELHGFKSWNDALASAKKVAEGAGGRLDEALYQPRECGGCESMVRPARQTVGPSGQWLHGLAQLPSGFALTWAYHCKSCGREEGAVPAYDQLVRVAMPDTSLMMLLASDLWSGMPPGEDFSPRVAELKRRGLVRQWRDGGKVYPTSGGFALWEHCRRVIAREALARPALRGRRPYFVVFDASNSPHAFKEWDRAESFARRAKDENPAAFAGFPEAADAIELWEAHHFPPDVLERVERDGAALVHTK